MKVSVDYRLLDKLRYNIKVHRLCKKMTECMDEEGVIDCAESTAKVLRIIPDCMKEDLIDKLIEAIDETRAKYGF